MANQTPSELSSSRYELVERLGAGASAEVWLGRDADGRAVTLKIGRDDHTATTLAREALHSSLARSARLPALVEVTRLLRRGDEAVPSHKPDARPALVLEYAPGRGLERQLGTTSPEAAVSIGHDVAAALVDLHDVGLAHGDIKPANVLIDDSGRARLIDLGLAGPAGSRDLRGATPRYLARGDRDLGDARARDLLALGLVLAELVDEGVAQSAEPLAIARAAQLPHPLDRIVAALLVPSPGSRPDARWALQRTAPGPVALAGDGPRRVRATYLRLRTGELSRAASCEEAVAPWLVEGCEAVNQSRRLCWASGAPAPAAVADGTLELGPLDLEGRRQWLVALVGRAAIDWPLSAVASVGEPRLAETLASLASLRSPETWSLADVEGALRGEPPRSTTSLDQGVDEDRVTILALALSRRPVDRSATTVVEQHPERYPSALRLAAADALRLAGQLGRARGLIVGLEEGGAIAADLLRRSGELEQAERRARKALSTDDPDGRARATLARLLLDRGEIADASRLVGEHPHHAAVAEVAALVAHAQGDPDRAERLAERGLALADTPETRARCAGALGYVKRHRDPEGARRSYRLAAAHAVEAGAVLEEASYRTGEAAACVDRGAIGEAIDTARRAVLLWDHVLHQPGMAARAWLARAAAHAGIDAEHETRLAAERAIEGAALSDDRRAQAHAWWSVADALPMGAPEAVEAARQAAELCGDEGGDDEGYDADHSAARLWRHLPEAVTAERRKSLDARCRHATADADVFVRSSWWSARAERLNDSYTGTDQQEAEARDVLSQLIALAESPTPVLTRGKAMHVGSQLAIAVGDSDSLARLDAARRRDASLVLAEVEGPLAETARACAWLSRAAAPVDEGPSRRERAIDLQRLVRALSERDELQTLLDRVVDVLLMWTGAERGLLLMPGQDGELEPRSARNLSRRDLRDEQLAMSSSLARRAMDSGEPVVAVDAMAELSSSYDSVHSLKLRSVLVVPLAARGKQLGCVYLDDRIRRGAFGENQVAWARSVAPVAALAISDAARQAALEEAVDRAERASRKLEEILAEKESALDVAKRQLAHSQRDRSTEPDDHGIVGDSEPIRRALHLIGRVAPSDVPVLLRGESGSGKELVARAIHRASARAKEPFVGENCGALPETLLESALFGHVKGAFIGADRPRVGLFEAADGGTLFLDEIGEMSLGMQAKLLRVLEDNLVRPVGSTRARQVNVRILAATHRDVESMVAEGTFREDLYYRLNVITVPVPPLRERAADVPALVRHFLDKHAPGRDITVSRAAMSQLGRQPWPGNVRQLENEIRRALIMAEDVIDTEHLSLTDDDGAASPRIDVGLDLRARIDQLETQLVGQALERTEGNQTQAAKLLGVSRYGLHKMMKRLGLKD